MAEKPQPENNAEAQLIPESHNLAGLGEVIKSALGTELSRERVLDDGSVAVIAYTGVERTNQCVVIYERNVGQIQGVHAQYREKYSWLEPNPEDSSEQTVRIENPRSKKAPLEQRTGFNVKDIEKIIRLVDSFTESETQT